jgi:small subunit ribosomal protein S2
VRGGGHVLFVATKKQAKQTVADESARSGMFFVTERWLGGMLTNFRRSARASSA